MSIYKPLTTRQKQSIIKHLIACEEILENRCAALDGDLECKEMSENNKYACIDANSKINDLYKEISTVRHNVQDIEK